MNPRSRTRSALLGAATTALSLLVSSCSEKEASAGPPGASARTQPLAPFQADLLDLAFRAASAFPLDPHIKTRSRTQEQVVDACLELDQPDRALRYLAGIENWRRGTACADVAYYLARHGNTSRVMPLLERAAKIADDYAKLEAAQQWRSDRIRAKIASTYLQLGDKDKAARFGGGVADSEAGLVDTAAAAHLDPAQFVARLAELDSIFKAGNFNRIQGALQTCVQLFDRFYDDAGRRDQVEQRVRESYDKLPPAARVGCLSELARRALAHHDPAKALDLCGVAEQRLQGANLAPEDQIGLTAALAELRGRADDASGARRLVDTALAAFTAAGPRIANIYRARALRPIAEALHAMGDREGCMALYERTVEAGLENPNSRPRAVDLIDTCLSLVRKRIEPDRKLRGRLEQVCEGLGEPW